MGAIVFTDLGFSSKFSSMKYEYWGGVRFHINNIWMWFSRSWKNIH